MTQGLHGRLQHGVEARKQTAGLTMADVRQLPPAERQLVNWLIHTGTLNGSAVATYLGQAEQAQSDGRVVQRHL